MICFLLAPAQLSVSCSTRYGDTYGRYLKNNTKLTVADSSDNYTREEGGGTHVCQYIQFIKRIVQERSTWQLNYDPVLEELGRRTFCNIQSSFLAELLVQFTNKHYFAWSSWFIKNSSYARIDRQAHKALCSSCTLREYCTVDCDALDELRRGVFLKALKVHADSLEDMLNEFLKERSGRMLPELHSKCDPARPFEFEETSMEETKKREAYMLGFFAYESTSSAIAEDCGLEEDPLER